MKKIILSLAALVLATTLPVKKSNAQFYFSASPGLQLNGANFGFKINKIVPYLGFQAAGASINFTESGKEYNGSSIVSYTDKMKFSGTIYMPSFGAKYFFLERNKLKAFGNLCYTMFLPSVKVEDNNDSEIEDDIKNELDNIRISGMQMGFGSEYFFDDNFSIGGEFGLRIIHLKYKNTEDHTVYNPGTGNYENSQTTYDYRLNINPTYVKISLNYYFAK